MKRTRSLLVWILTFGCLAHAAAQWLPQRSGVTVGLRGLSAVSRKVAWAGGAKGTFLRTTDGGETWRVDSVAGAAGSDFRDVYAVNDQTAYLLSSGELARIYKTHDGGKSWLLQYESKTFGAFLDGFAFWDDTHGIAFGDPLGGRFLILTTADGGQTWQEAPFFNIPPALPEEAAFAASGTSICVQGTRHAWFCTGGGKQARVFRTADGGTTWSVANLPLTCHSPSSGAFSIAFQDSLRGVVVGGDFLAPNQPLDNYAVTEDGGRTWTLQKTLQPVGLKQCIAYMPGKTALIATGESGTGYSLDGGRTWTSVEAPKEQVPYYSISFARDGKAAWAVGAKGTLGKLAKPFLQKMKKSTSVRK